MSESIEYYSSSETSKLSKILSPIWRDIGFPEKLSSARKEAIKLLKHMIQQEPNEWLYWYALTRYLSYGGFELELSEAVRAGEFCCQLKPNDLRSLYAVGSALRSILRAKYYIPLKGLSQKEMLEASRHEIERSRAWPGPDIFSTNASYKSLQALGLTLEQAAEKTIRIYELVLSKASKNNEKKLLRDSLSTMSSEFPFIQRYVL